MRVYEQVAEELQQQGVTTVFGLIGQDTMRLAAVAATRGLRYVATRHEMGAVTMAAGYGRVTHTVAVAIVSRGPGLTNAMSGIVGAAKAGTPLIVLSGDEPLLEGRGRDPKYVDQSAMLGAAGVRVTHPESAETAQAELRDAFDQARRGLTVAVLIPLDVLEADSQPLGKVPQAKAPEQSLRANAASVHAAADLIEGCGSDARIAIVAGRGAIAPDSVAALAQLGEITGALMGTTIMAKSLFDTSGNNLGVVGTFSSTATREYLAGTHVVIAAGASLNPFTTQKGALFPGAVVIQIDVDHDAFGRYITPNVPIHADVRSGAADLAAELERRGFHGRGRDDGIFAPRSPLSTANGTSSTSDEGDVLDPYELMRRLDRILPKERIVAVDAGHQLTFACAVLSVPDPDAFLFPIEFQCIGTALGMAIGAAVARPDLLTVVSLGDGALMMGLGELDTAIQLGLRLLLLIINDGGFGAERHYLDMLGLPADTARFVNPVFEDIALAMGADAMTLHNLNDLPALAAKLDSRLMRPLLVDCLIDGRVRGEWLDSNLRREPAPSVALS